MLYLTKQFRFLNRGLNIKTPIFRQGFGEPDKKTISSIWDLEGKLFQHEEIYHCSRVIGLTPVWTLEILSHIKAVASRHQILGGQKMGSAVYESVFLSD